MAYIIEQAGGLATNGVSAILDVVPESIHQRMPIFMGSREDVEDLQACFARHAAVWGVITPIFTGSREDGEDLQACFARHAAVWGVITPIFTGSREDGEDLQACFARHAAAWDVITAIFTGSREDVDCGLYPVCNWSRRFSKYQTQRAAVDRQPFAEDFPISVRSNFRWNIITEISSYANPRL